MRASQEFLKVCVAVFGMLLSADRVSADCYTLTYGYVNGDPNDTGATGSWFSSAYRLNGNEVYMYSNTGVSGPNAPLVITHVKSTYYRNGTLAIGPTTYDGSSGGATVTGYYWQYLFYSGQYYLGDFQVGHSPGNLNDHWGTSPYCESLGYHPIYVHHSDVSNIYTAVKPTIEVTGDPSNPKSTRWAFWYLGGAPSIDGYYTQVAMTGHTKWGADTSPISWSVSVGGLKVSLSPTSGSQTQVTSLAPSASSPSAGYVYDVSVQINTDGLPSDGFPLCINIPSYLTSQYAGPQTIPGGWQESFLYQIHDPVGAVLSPVTLHETLENQAA